MVSSRSLPPAPPPLFSPLPPGIVVNAIEHPDALNDDFQLFDQRSRRRCELAEVIWKKIPGPTTVPFRLRIDDPFEHDVQSGSCGRQGAARLGSREPRA